MFQEHPNEPLTCLNCGHYERVADPLGIPDLKREPRMQGGTDRNGKGYEGPQARVPGMGARSF